MMPPAAIGGGGLFPRALLRMYLHQDFFHWRNAMGKTMGLATIMVVGIGLVFGMGGLLVAAAVAPLIGVVLWVVAKGMKWL